MSTPYYSDDHVTLLVGDAREALRSLPDESVHCCVTSPPYWGLRDYGCEGQMGLEETPEAYVAGMVEVFREVRRVLRDDGTLWLNLGDSYARQGGRTDGVPRHWDGRDADPGGMHAKRSLASDFGAKPKDLVGIPWRVAFALQADGWWLRSDIIWSKPNPMPESVRDRPTKAHEYVFLLSKSERYFYDAAAIAEQSMYPGDTRHERADTRKTVDPMCADKGSRRRTGNPTGSTRNRRTVWTITTKPYPEAHFATFPPELPETCIKAGTSERGCCPYCGSPWVRVIDSGKNVHPGDSGRTHAQGPVQRGKREDGRAIGSIMRERHQARTKPVTIGWEPSCDCAEDEDADGIAVERPDEPTDMWLPRPVPCTVLDLFAGAGTTLYVAKELNREAIGVELNPAYAQLIVRRVAQGVLAL